MTIVLGIESSCDETACALVNDQGDILNAQVWSQYDEHRRFGGVVPEIAARAHLEKCDVLIRQAMQEASLSWDDLSAIAVSGGPGLIGGVLVGVITAKTLALCRGLPFIALNHLEAHALMARMQNPHLTFPYLLLLTSGGHCQVLLVKGVGQFQKLGGTLDDSAGEAFDKVAKMLAIGYPGGPNLEKYALNGNAKRFVFPVPMQGKKGCDFSFSGLKTAVRTVVAKLPVLTEQDKADICAGFQGAVVKQMTDRLTHAFEMYRHLCPTGRSVVISGGVAANKTVRRAIGDLAHQFGYQFYAPDIQLCTDNGVMVAWGGIEHFKVGQFSDLNFQARPRWPLESLSDSAMS